MKEKTKQIVRISMIAIAVVALIMGVVFFVAFEKSVRAITTANGQMAAGGYTRPTIYGQRALVFFGHTQRRI